MPLILVACPKSVGLAWHGYQAIYCLKQIKTRHFVELQLQMNKRVVKNTYFHLPKDLRGIIIKEWIILASTGKSRHILFLQPIGGRLQAKANN